MSRLFFACAWLLAAGFCGYVAIAHASDTVIMPFYACCSVLAAATGGYELVRP